MSAEMLSPAVGGMFRSEEGGFEVHVTKDRDCEEDSAVLQCCGQMLQKTPA